MSRRPFRRSRALAPALLLLAVAAAILAAGCGDGDDAAEVSAEDLVRMGDAICVEGRQEFNEIQAESPATAVAAADQVEALIEVADDELDSLRNLIPPEQLQARYDAYLAARESAVELLSRGHDAAEDKDSVSYGKAQAKAAAGQAERLKLARAVGFEQCSKG